MVSEAIEFHTTAEFHYAYNSYNNTFIFEPGKIGITSTNYYKIQEIRYSQVKTDRSVAWENVLEESISFN